MAKASRGRSRSSKEPVEHYRGLAVGPNPDGPTDQALVAQRRAKERTRRTPASAAAKRAGKKGRTRRPKATKGPAAARVTKAAVAKGDEGRE